MTTIRDVAKAAGVSVSTVSHVVNGTRFVTPETAERVRIAMQHLDYRPNRLARSLRNRQTHSLGVIVPNSANIFFADVLLGIETRCFDLGYNIIIGNAFDDPERELLYLKVLLSRQVDGLVLISTGAQAESLALLEERDTPVILVDRAMPGADVDEISTDNYLGGRLATEYLLGLGHQHIACISGPLRLAPSIERVSGYRDALTEAGIPVNPDYILPADFQSEAGYRAATTLLCHPQRPTAIFACNDMMAIGAIAAAEALGLHVPQDLSVLGYDDIELAAYIQPRLTTIAQPGQELGHQAAEHLIMRLQNPGLPRFYQSLPVSLIERDSCQSLASVLSASHN